MGKVILRPTVASDIPHMIDGLTCRIKAITGVMVDEAGNETILGLGGLAFPPGGPVIAFMQQAPEAKRYPVSFHRAGLMGMAMVRRTGVREVVATTDAGSPVNGRWLERLGFRQSDMQNIPGKIVWFWHHRETGVRDR